MANKITNEETARLRPVAPKSLREEAAASRHEAPTGVQSVEPEDAHLTGGSKSHRRQVLDLNVDDQGGQAQRHPETTAGQHATGSFPDPADDASQTRSER